MPRKRQGARLVRRKLAKSKNSKSKLHPDWFIRFYDEELKRWRDLTTSEEDYDAAEEILENFKRDLRALKRGKLFQHANYTVAQVLDEYALFKLNSPSAERLSYSMEHLLNFWDEQSLDCVNVESVKKYKATAPRAIGTVRRELTDLRSSIHHAVKMSRIVPFQFPELGKKPISKMRFLRRSEIANIIWSARKAGRSRKNVPLFCLIAYYTGARKGVIMDLTWDQIHFDENEIDFRDADLGETNKRRAIVPMHPMLRHILYCRSKLYDNRNEEERCAYVFYQKRKPQLRVKSIDKGFRSAVKQTNLKNVTPHTLRHTRVSEFAQAGEAPLNVAAFMAMSMHTIFEVYAHVDTDHLQGMANRIGRTHKNQTTYKNRWKDRRKDGK